MHGLSVMFAPGTLHGPAVALKPQYEAPTGMLAEQMARLAVKEGGSSAEAASLRTMSSQMMHA